MALAASASARANAESLLLVEADSGKVLHSENATSPWYPASVTKIMTAYVTLRAVKEGRLRLDSTIPVSANAAAQAPSKMGFPVGTLLTIDNAIKMLMVKSANDIAVVLAEGVSGSIEAFAAEMNDTAKRLGMTQSHFVNPNGLPDDAQVTSARDLAILARTVLREMPEHQDYWRIPAIRFGKRLMRNTNKLIDAYPGADGMKTGFICASGFNVVATATRGDKRLIAVVLGAPSSPVRAVKAAQLFERGFAPNPLAWLTPALGTVDALAPVDAPPPNLREDMCGKHRKRPAAENADEDIAKSDPNSPLGGLLASLRAPMPKAADLIGSGHAATPPVVVYTGPMRTTATAILSSASDPSPKRKAAKRAQAKSGVSTAAKRGDASQSATGKPGVAAKSAAATKPAATGQNKASPAASAKPPRKNVSGQSSATKKPDPKRSTSEVKR